MGLMWVLSGSLMAAKDLSITSTSQTGKEDEKDKEKEEEERRDGIRGNEECLLQEKNQSGTCSTPLPVG